MLDIASTRFTPEFGDRNQPMPRSREREMNEGKNGLNALEEDIDLTFLPYSTI